MKALKKLTLYASVFTTLGLTACGGGGGGGGGGGSTQTNQPPSFTSPSTATLAENITSVYEVQASDPEGAALTFTLSGNDASALELQNCSPNNSNQGTLPCSLVFKSAPDFETPTDTDGDNVYNVTIEATDGSNTASLDLAINITNTNDIAPVVTANNVSVAENTTSVTTVSASDADNLGGLTFSLAGADASAFSITGSGSTASINFNSAPNFEFPNDNGGNNIYDIDVVVSDGTNSSTQNIKVTVTNVNEAPTITSNTTSFSRNENSGTGSFAQLAAQDPDAATVLTYSLAGTDASKFSIDGGGEVSFVNNPDYENAIDNDNNNVYNITVKVSDGALSNQQNWTITVADINDNAPTISGTPSGTFAENTANIQMAFNMVDIDSVGNSNCVLGGADGNKFTVNLSNNQCVVSFTGTPDFDSPADTGNNNVYDFTIAVNNPPFSSNVLSRQLTITNLQIQNSDISIAPSDNPRSIDITWTDNGEEFSTVTLVQSTNSGSTFTAVSSATNLPNTTTKITIEKPYMATQLASTEYRLEFSDASSVIETSPSKSLSNLTSRDLMGYFKASDVSASSNYGFATTLSKDGNTMAVGAPLEDSSSINAGKVYVYKKDSNGLWSEQATLTAAVPLTQARFGVALSLSNNGDRLVVGADRRDSGSLSDVGAVHVFERSGNTWGSAYRIDTPVSSTGDTFGSDVAISSDGNTIIIGAPLEDSNLSAPQNGGDVSGLSNNGSVNSGAAYIYTRASASNWVLQSTLKASNSEAGDKFGFSVAISNNGNRVVVGAPEEDGASNSTNTTSSGAAYIFSRDNNNNWAQDRILRQTPNLNILRLHKFGSKVAISGDGKIIAGSAPNSQTQSSSGVVNSNGALAGCVGSCAVNSGIVYVYAENGSTWYQDAYFKANTVVENEFFGSGLAINDSGTVITVGAGKNSAAKLGIDGALDTGAGNSLTGNGGVYVYRNKGTSPTTSNNGSNWQFEHFLKGFYLQLDTFIGDIEGLSVSGEWPNITVAAGARGEDSSDMGINQNKLIPNDSATNSGAVILY